MPLLSYLKVTGSTIDNHEVLVRAGPVDRANPFGVSIDGCDFKPVDTSWGSEVFIGCSFSLIDQRQRGMRLGS